MSLSVRNAKHNVVLAETFETMMVISGPFLSVMPVRGGQFVSVDCEWMLHPRS